jgi:hypothetical protein
MLTVSQRIVIHLLLLLLLLMVVLSIQALRASVRLWSLLSSCRRRLC